MNVIVVSAVMPYPLHSGGQVRIYNLLQRLSKHHKITLVAYVRSMDEICFKDNLAFCDEVIPVYRGRAWRPSYLIKSISSDVPWLFSTYDIQMMRDTISRVMQRKTIDLIHIEPGYVFLGLPHHNLPLVTAEHNIEHTVYDGYARQSAFPLLRPFFNHDVKKIMKWERIVWQQSDDIITVSQSDKQEIVSLGFSHATVVPNGVNDEWFTYRERKKIPQNFTALFLGNFRWMQNKEAVERLLVQIWPAIMQKYPLAQLKIVGPHFPDSLKKYCHESVHLLHIQEDIRDAFSQVDMLLAPIEIGGGTKYKILEAMASGVPVITTKKGIEGLDVTNSQELLVAQSTQDWISTIEVIQKNHRLMIDLTEKARQLVESKYSWRTIANIQHNVWQRYYEK